MYVIKHQSGVIEAASTLEYRIENEEYIEVPDDFIFDPGAQYDICDGELISHQKNVKECDPESVITEILDLI